MSCPCSACALRVRVLCLRLSLSVFPRFIRGVAPVTVKARGFRDQPTANRGQTALRLSALCAACLPSSLSPLPSLSLFLPRTPPLPVLTPTHTPLNTHTRTQTKLGLDTESTLNRPLLPAPLTMDFQWDEGSLFNDLASPVSSQHAGESYSQQQPSQAQAHPSSADTTTSTKREEEVYNGLFGTGSSTSSSITTNNNNHASSSNNTAASSSNGFHGAAMLNPPSSTSADGSVLGLTSMDFWSTSPPSSSSYQDGRASQPMDDPVLKARRAFLHGSSSSSSFNQPSTTATTTNLSPGANGGEMDFDDLVNSADIYG